MLPRDFDGDPDKAAKFEADLLQFESERKKLVDRQNAAVEALSVAEDHLTLLTSWKAALGDHQLTTYRNALQLGSLDKEPANTHAALAQISGLIWDAAQAYEIATARLLGGPKTNVPIVLLPLRLETHWDPAPTEDSGTTLNVRIYPDVLSIDAHQPTLTSTEHESGARYWEARSHGGPVDIDQAWMQLVHASGPQRAAWIVIVTDPAAADPVEESRQVTLDAPVTARLLPGRFAVVAFSAAGVPVNLAASDQPPRLVTWSRDVPPDPLPCGPLRTGGGAAWMTDPAKAVEVGMAVRIPVAAGTPPIDTLAVIGLRNDPAPDLAGLLTAHCYTDGLEILDDGTPTNNSSQIRAAHSPTRDADVARALIEDPPADPALDPTRTAGAQVGRLLGIPAARLATVAGGSRSRAVADAMRRLVGFGATGALRDRLGAAGSSAWPVVSPDGPSPALRVGRQPYGILPVTAPGRWRPERVESSAKLAPHLHEWARATRPPIDQDPGAAPPAHLGSGPARRVGPADDAALTQVLPQAASTLRWFTKDASTGPGTQYTGLDLVVGPADGDRSPATYLPRIAQARDLDLATVAATLPDTLLSRVAYHAKRQAADNQSATIDVNDALWQLASGAARPSGRHHLAQALLQMLDASSHRFDAWITGAANERLDLALDYTPERRVGGFGWLTDVQPRTAARSQGHVHAPSLGQAATAAVLRAGHLGQRRQSGHDTQPARSDSAHPLSVNLSSRRVRAATWTLAAVRAGQPLGAVLGYQFERDLVDSGLAQYLSAFRKLTRFHTGTALEKLQEKRHAAGVTLSQKRRALDALEDEAARLRREYVTAAGEATAEVERHRQAELAAKPYVVDLPAERVALSDPANAGSIPRLRAEVARLDAELAAHRQAARRAHVIQVPDREDP